MSNEAELFEIKPSDVQDTPPNALAQVIKDEGVEEQTGVRIQSAFSPFFAEAERLERIKAEEIERQRIDDENKKLREENEANERALAAERAKAESERLVAQKLADKAKAESDAKLKLEREAKERAEAQIKAQAQAKADEKERIRIAAEKAMSASDDVKLEALALMLDNLEYPVVSSQNAKITIDNAKGDIESIVKIIRSRIGK